jgi:hypothetical protein
MCVQEPLAGRVTGCAARATCGCSQSNDKLAFHSVDGGTDEPHGVRAQQQHVHAGGWLAGWLAGTVAVVLPVMRVMWVLPVMFVWWGCPCLLRMCLDSFRARSSSTCMQVSGWLGRMHFPCLRGVAAVAFFADMIHTGISCCPSSGACELVL